MLVSHLAKNMHIPEKKKLQIYIAYIAVTNPNPTVLPSILVGEKDDFFFDQSIGGRHIELCLRQACMTVNSILTIAWCESFNHGRHIGLIEVL